MKLFLCLTLFALTAMAASTAAAATSLREAFTFHASFDHGPEADFGQDDRRLFRTPSRKSTTNPPPLRWNRVVVNAWLLPPSNC
jgi:hypothetical protein